LDLEVMMIDRVSCRAAWLGVLLLGLLPSKGTAQCATQWSPGNGLAGTNGVVNAVLRWDPDGAGPLSEHLVVGGAFTIAGNQSVSNIALFDLATGVVAPLGSGMPGPVLALAVLPNGDLVAGGNFSSAGGTPANRIARWNGTSWSPLAQGTNAPVHAMHVLPNGNLVAGGSFTQAGGASAGGVAMWNGTSWSTFGSGINSAVYAITAMPNGDLIVGGSFNTAGGVGSGNIARWNGTAWGPLVPAPGNSVNSAVMGLAVRANGDLVACGQFTIAGGVPAVRVATWNGSSWAPLGAGINNDVRCVTTLANGDILAGGAYSLAGGLPARGIARWNGAAWSPVGVDFPGNVYALTELANGGVVAGGLFDGNVSPGAANLARFDGTSWTPVVTGSTGAVSAAVALPNGELVVGGSFLQIAGVFANRIARISASVVPLGTGLNSGVRSLALLPNGDLIAAGWFTEAGGLPADSIARWDGTAWSAIGGQGGVVSLVVMPNGDLVAGGTFTAIGGVNAARIARWNGASWSPLGAGLGPPLGLLGVPALTLLALPNGDLIVGGDFANAGGAAATNIARWNGAIWSTLGAGLGTPPYPQTIVRALAAMPNGDLVAAGEFSSSGAIAVNRIARWNGATWAPLGSGFNASVAALHLLPNGDLLAGGDFLTAGGTLARKVARWNGAAWSALGGNIDGSLACFAARPNGGITVGGTFTIVDGTVAAYLTELTTTCPAIAASSGTGCTGSGGRNVLTATTLPWTGSTFRATATGMPALSFVLSVYGFTPLSIPLSAVLPQALPGCTAQMSLDYAEVLLPSAGAVQTALAIPNAAPLAGLGLHHYVLPFEFDASLQVLAITNSNALALTVGSF
jgi:trimeric autotransporter adhesin